jgi:uncharacterized protein
MTLAWNCRTRQEVDSVLDFAVSKGASLLKPARQTGYGGYSGYFADPDNHPWEVVARPVSRSVRIGAFICRTEPL